jgi:hypothetical protein
MLSIFFFLLAGLFTFGSAGLASISGQDANADATSLSQALVVSAVKHKPPHCGGPEDERDNSDNEHRGKRDNEHESKKDHDPKQCPISNQ